VMTRGHTLDDVDQKEEKKSRHLFQHWFINHYYIDGDSASGVMTVVGQLWSFYAFSSYSSTTWWCIDRGSDVGRKWNIWWWNYMRVIFHFVCFPLAFPWFCSDSMDGYLTTELCGLEFVSIVMYSFLYRLKGPML
jgi:hypothetical protein